MTPETMAVPARGRDTAAALGEPRWTICIDGDAVEIALRPTASPWVWVPTILFIPAPLAMAWACAWLARWIVRYSFPLHGAYEAFGLVFGAGSLALAAIWCLRIAVKEMAWMLWIWTGLERTTVGPNDVRIDRDGAGIAKVAVLPRTPGAPIEVARRPLLGDVLSFRWGLPRPGTYGALRVAAPGGGHVLLGIDLTAAEAAAIVAEIELIRGVSGRGQCKPAN